MNQSTLFEFDPLLLLTLLIFTLAGQPPPAAAAVAVDPYFVNCSVPTTCGRHPIKFPFYIDRAYCGNPGFNVSCTNQTLILTVSGSQLVVNEIFYHNLSISVSIAAAVGSEEPRCFPQIRNFSVEENERFDLAPNQTEMFMASSCNVTSAPALSRYRIADCPGGEGESNSSLVLFRDDGGVGNISRNCRSAVVSPVRAREGGGGGGDYLGLLRRGFLLEWVTSDCSVCNETGGYCGFNQSSRHFQCFCPDRPHAARCNGPEWFPEIYKCSQYCNNQPCAIGVCNGQCCGG